MKIFIKQIHVFFINNETVVATKPNKVKKQILVSNIEQVSPPNSLNVTTLVAYAYAHTIKSKIEKNNTTLNNAKNLPVHILILVSGFETINNSVPSS
jgi:hypothetical protein